MGTWIALLRGVNVGGANLLPMRQWAEDLADLQLANVKTYIQSGNAVFESPVRSAGEISRRIADDLQRRYGYSLKVWVLSAASWVKVLGGNPFPEGEGDPKSLHVYFLASPAVDPDLAELQKLRSADERFQLAREVFYLHAPAGIGRSKMAARIERCLGVSTTARNWNTVAKLAEISGAK